MRPQGINLPDPQVTGDDIVQQLPSRAEQDSPKFKAAQQAWRQYGSLLPAVKPGGPQRGGGGR